MSGNKLKVYDNRYNGDRLFMTAYPGRDPNRPTINFSASKGLAEGLALKANQYVTPVKGGTKMGIPFNEYELEKNFDNGLAASAVMNEYDGHESYGADISVGNMHARNKQINDVLDGMRVGIKIMDNKDRGRTNSAYVGKYSNGGYLSAKVKQRENQDPTYRVEYNKKF